eukprot:8945502-Prorocentrum_lima.AAC.1
MEPFSGITKPFSVDIGSLVDGLRNAKFKAVLLIKTFSQERAAHTMGARKITQSCGFARLDNLDH